VLNAEKPTDWWTGDCLPEIAIFFYMKYNLFEMEIQQLGRVSPYIMNNNAGNQKI